VSTCVQVGCMGVCKRPPSDSFDTPAAVSCLHHSSSPHNPCHTSPTHAHTQAGGARAQVLCRPDQHQQAQGHAAVHGSL
jgi:hypothetical protein